MTTGKSSGSRTSKENKGQSSSAVAKAYAQALFEICDEFSCFQGVIGSFENFISLYDSSAELRLVLNSFTFSAQDKLNVVQSLSDQVGLDAVFVRFLKILINKDRIQALIPIYTRFGLLLDEKENRLRGQVISAEALSDVERADLSRTFSKKFNKQVVLEQEIDRALLGGLVVEVGGLTFDGSVRRALSQMREALEKNS